MFIFSGDLWIIPKSSLTLQKIPAVSSLFLLILSQPIISRIQRITN